MVARLSQRPEFAEIPEEIRARIEEEAREMAFTLLHAEAVEQGDLPAPPRTYFDGLAGRILRTVLLILVGFLIGITTIVGVTLLLKRFSVVV
ncbi:MAG: hypothetical protein ACE5H3_00355 [Planctomycetota bacterium]